MGHHLCRRFGERRCLGREREHLAACCSARSQGASAVKLRFELLHCPPGRALGWQWSLTDAGASPRLAPSEKLVRHRLRLVLLVLARLLVRVADFAEHAPTATHFWPMPQRGKERLRATVPVRACANVVCRRIQPSGRSIFFARRRTEDFPGTQQAPAASVLLQSGAGIHG